MTMIVMKINNFKDFDGFKKSREFVKITGELVRTAKCAQDQELVQYESADRLGEEATRLIGGLMTYLSRSGASGAKFRDRKL
jgi:hypothetical protein